MAEIRITAMTAQYAADVLSWRYPAPYDYYDVTDGDLDYYLDPANGFFAVLSGREFIGFRSFGPDGQVPGGTYDDSALDTGGGLRPDLTGRGLGLNRSRPNSSPAATTDRPRKPSARWAGAIASHPSSSASLRSSSDTSSSWTR